MEHKTVIVGLTGQTGAGKSTVRDMLSARGYRFIDADSVARTVVEKGKRCLLELAAEFGSIILNSDETLNRRMLASIVFGDRDKQKRLGEITFPHIKDEISGMMNAYRISGEPAVFLDAPTLFESGADRSCDKIVSIIAPPEERFMRILRRDNLTVMEAKKRISAQHDDDFYTTRSDFVIINDGDTTDLRVKVMEMLDVCGVPLIEL